MLGRFRPAGGGEGEGGFTLTELLVAMSVLMLVLGSLLGALESLTRTQATTSTRIDDEQTLRLALAQFTRDLRDANQLQAASTGSADFLLDGTPAAEVRWSYDPASQTLSRSVVSGTAPPTLSLSSVTAASFAWLDAAGVSGQTWASDTDRAHCATEVQATVTVAARRGAAPITQTVQAALRNQGPFGGCG